MADTLENAIEQMLDVAMPLVRRDAKQMCMAWSDDFVKATRSPIEAKLLLAISFSHSLYNAFNPLDLHRSVVLVSPEDDFEKSFASFHKREAFPHVITVIQPQSKIGDYRADFLIAQSCLYTKPLESRRYVVECDGHDYHERTPEQAQHDRSRDRSMLASGFVVMRFTGREIVRDPASCVGQVLGMMRKDIDAAALNESGDDNA